MKQYCNVPALLFLAYKLRQKSKTSVFLENTQVYEHAH
jgi:hypothetical protein